MKRCLALLVLCAATARAQAEPERISRAYDIRFLTTEVQNFRGPAIGLEESDGDASGIPGMPSTDENGPAPVTGEFLTSAITTNFDEDSWSDDRNRIEYSEGVLYVTNTKENQDRIAKYLEMLRKRFSRRIVVEAEVLLLSPEAFAATGALPGILPADQDKALRDAAADPARGKLLTLLRAVAVNGQRVFAADLHETSYVRDYDVEIAQDAAVADPILGDLVTGAVLDVRPILANDMATVFMDSRFKMARPRGIVSFDPATSTGGTIQLPSNDVLRTKTTLSIPVGRSVLLCAGPIAGEKDWLGVVLLRVTLTGQAGTDETVSTEKRQMRMFDVSSLTAMMGDFPGPSLSMGSDEAGGGPSTAFSPPMEEGRSITPEELLAAIKENVARDSWKNVRNKLSLMGDQVVVVQSPAVLDEIAKFIAVAAPARNRIIGVEAVLVGLDEAAWTARRASLSGASPSEDALKDLLAAALKGGGVRIVSSARGAGMSDQRFHVWAGGAQAFVQDDDVEIAQGAAATDPVIGILTTGCVLDIRPTLAGDGKRIAVELRPQFNAAQSPETFDPKAVNVGKIQKIRASVFKVQTQLYVPDGGWNLVGVATGTAGGKREILAMLVRARSMEAK
ncbi:MAG: hypothetical protein K8T20_18830 [Planctomycetes bacterium]|nr:hypothetical protein [Planctomycetota bacterium]